MSSFLSAFLSSHFAFFLSFSFLSFSNSHLSPLPPQTHTRTDARLCKPLSRAWQVWENLFAVQRISPVSTQTDTYLIHTHTHTISIFIRTLWASLMQRWERTRRNRQEENECERDGWGRVWKHYVTPVGGAGLQVWRLSPAETWSSRVMRNHCSLFTHSPNTQHKLCPHTRISSILWS